MTGVDACVEPRTPCFAAERTCSSRRPDATRRLDHLDIESHLVATADDVGFLQIVSFVYMTGKASERRRSADGTAVLPSVKE